MYVNKLTWNGRFSRDDMSHRYLWKHENSAQRLQQSLRKLAYWNVWFKVGRSYFSWCKGKKSIEMFKKHSPKTPVVGTSSKYFVCRTREARYGGKPTKPTLARAQKCLISFPVPVAVHKTVGANWVPIYSQRRMISIYSIWWNLGHLLSSFVPGSMFAMLSLLHVVRATALRDRYTTPIQRQVSIKCGYSLVEISV